MKEVTLERGEKYQVELRGNEVIVSKVIVSKVIMSKETEWEDVTKSCCLEFRSSQHCNGRYIAVMYGNKMAAVIGTAGIQSQKGFSVKKPSGAYTSFQVLRKNG